MVYRGNNIGISKVEGILTQKTNLKNWKYRDFLPGPEPFVTKDVPDSQEENVSLFDKKWYQRYADSTGLAVERRADDAVRIAKFIASGRGILWESEMAGLETIQKELQQGTLDNYKKIQDSAPEEAKSFWQTVGSILTSAGKSILTNIGLTAGTLAQTAASGTGYHGTTYASRAYLRKGTASSTLIGLLASIGVVDGDYLVGATYVQKGQNIPISGDSVASDKKFIPSGEPATEQHTNRINKMNPVPEKKEYGVDTDLSGVGTRGAEGVNLQKSVVDLNGQKIDVQKTIQQALALKGATYSIPGTDQPNVPQVPVKSEIRQQDLAAISQNKRYGTVREVDKSVESRPTVASTYEASAPIGDTYTIHSKPRAYRPVEPTLEKYFYHVDLAKTGPTGGKYRADINVENKDNLEDLGLTPFCISTITPDWRTYINFPINLESYDDNYSGNWEATQYVGRGENFYGYTGFTRSINFAFKVVALHEDDLLTLYRRLNRLVGATAPSYDKVNGGLFMRGTLSCITLGDLLVEQFGFISNIKLTWQKDYLWVPAPSSNGVDKTGWQEKEIMLPNILDVSIAFTPIERNTVRESYRSFFVFKPEEEATAYIPKDEIKKTEIPVDETEPETRRLDFGLPTLEEIRTQIEHTAVSTMQNVLGGGGGYGGNNPAVRSDKLVGVPTIATFYSGNLWPTASFRR